MSLFDYSLGDFVTHSERPDWGVGQVQSIEGTRITVNFENESVKRNEDIVKKYYNDLLFLGGNNDGSIIS